jgi:hypothetical protein
MVREAPVPGMKAVLFAALIVAVSSNPKPARGQSPWWSVRQIMSDLRENGVKYDTDRATLWFEAGMLSPDRMEEFAGLANRGIVDIESFLKIAPRENKIRYYISSQVEISQAMGNSILLPMQKVMNGNAPYLHETSHILAPCRDCPMWFSEGLASYLQSYVGEHKGGYDGAVFTRHGNTGIDRDTARWLAREKGQAVLPFVGKHGEPPEIAYDRSGVAAPFYVMSQSLIKFIVDRVGIEKLETVLIADDFDDAMQKATGKSVDQWKELWLAAVTPPK